MKKNIKSMKKNIKSVGRISSLWVEYPVYEEEYQVCGKNIKSVGRISSL